MIITTGIKSLGKGSLPRPVGTTRAISDFWGLLSPVGVSRLFWLGPVECL